MIWMTGRSSRPRALSQLLEVGTAIRAADMPGADELMLRIYAAMAQKEIKAGSYNRCARYCVEKGVMLKDALGWAERAVSMDRKYWTLHTLALAQAANGNYRDATNTARESLELAAKEGDNGYVKMNEDRIVEWSAK